MESMRQQNLHNAVLLYSRDDGDKFGALNLHAANLPTRDRMHLSSKRQFLLLNHTRLPYFAFFRR